MQQSLFAISSPQRRSAIARFAAQAQLVEEKRTVEYFRLATRSILNRCHSPRMPFDWTINPYRGCEIACKYCYARYTHEFMELRDPFDFEDKIYAKLWDREGFRKDLAKAPLRDAIAIGTATDPYQPAERRFGVTRAILEELAGEGGRRIYLTTKSDLVLRDVDVLLDVARRNTLCVSLTVTTMDAELARLLEPKAPRPDLRMKTVKELSRQGLGTGVLCCPVIQLINDGLAGLEGVAKEASRAGAQWIGSSVLFLKPGACQVFLPFIELNFPHLSGRFRRLFARRAFLRGDYPGAIRRKMNMLRDKYGLHGRPVEYPVEAAGDSGQLDLEFR